MTDRNRELELPKSKEGIKKPEMYIKKKVLNFDVIYWITAACTNKGGALF